MHLFKKTLGLIAILSAIPAAYAATARPSEVARVSANQATATSRGGKTSVGIVVAGNSTLKTGGNNDGGDVSVGALLADSECVDAYRDCVSESDACGTNFEECTTNVLFHAQMPKCLSVLRQCSAAGIKSLFGAENDDDLSASTKNTYGEITDYTYPTAGSVLGQLITAASIANRYDTATCVRRYTSCLKKDNVCGDDFELCTSTTEFKKQRLFCESTLARCQSEGVKELFGSADRTATPSNDSRIGVLITEGKELAGLNAASTCYKVFDQCVSNACSGNPFKCKENTSEFVTALADGIVDGDNANTVKAKLLQNADNNNLINEAAVKSYIRGECETTVGSNSYCFMTYKADGGNSVIPTTADLRNPENQENVFNWLYGERMENISSKIDKLVSDFDATAKTNCAETVKSCAMRTCGGGSGAACYKQAYKTSNAGKSINATPYDGIKSSCEMIVNGDANCQYAYYADKAGSTGFTPKYTQDGIFNYVFPAYNNGSYNDVVGVVAYLNKALSENYDDAALEQMKTQCENVAKSCIISMCGTDYVNCYRSRTDVYSNTYNTENTTFNQSMNKVSGILDHTIISGLCMDVVKSSDACTEHLKMEYNESSTNGNTTWGTAKTVREAWNNAAKNVSLADVTTDIVDGCTTNSKVAVMLGIGNKCDTSKVRECGSVDNDGCLYDQEHTVSINDYNITQAAENLFDNVLTDIEKKAQAAYNVKLTREKNMCTSSNNGGIVANNDMGRTFMWVKLKSNKVPSDYSVNGLKAGAFGESNDLYGSFCRVRITLQSDDKKIQDAMRGKDWTTAYFATGDSFTCGSWIPESALAEIANKKVGTVDDAAHKRTRFWTTAAAVVGGGVGGYFLGDKIAGGDIMAGLTGRDQKSTDKRVVSNCEEAIADFRAATSYSKAIKYGNELLEATHRLKIDNIAFLNALGEVKAKDGQAEVSADNEAACKKIADANYLDYGSTCSCDKLEIFDTDHAKGVSTKNEKKTKEIQKECNKLMKTASSDEIEAETKANADKEAWNLLSKCQRLNEDQHATTKGDRVITIATTAAGALASGLLVRKATLDIQQTALDDEQKAAYEEFMNSVGRHITCYIGGDEAGSYGDVITTSLE